MVAAFFGGGGSGGNFYAGVDTSNYISFDLIFLYYLV